MNIFDLDDHQKEEEKIIKKQDKIINEEIPETIQENISMYSNTEIPEKNNNKYCRNYDDINNLKSSIFDGEENDHIKKYEQEINTEEHPYLFNYNSNVSNKDKNKNKYSKNYTFKNSDSMRNNVENNNSNKNSDYDKSNDFILNNKSSFKNLEGLRSKKNMNNNDQFISFGNNEIRRTEELKQQNDINNYSDKNMNKENENNLNIIKNSENKNYYITNKNGKINEIENQQNDMNNIKINNEEEINENNQNSDTEENEYERKSNKRDNNIESNINDIIEINDELIQSLSNRNQTEDKTILNTSQDFGIRYYSNGSIYIGQFKDNKCNGYGKYRQENDGLRRKY